MEPDPKPEADEGKPKKKPLSAKQRQFVEHYLACFNATEAARRAGYSEKSAANIGWENVRKPEIAEAISRRMQETAMSADEVLMRLADQARGSMGDFVTIADDGLPAFDLKAAKAAGKLHLVRKLKTKTRYIHLGKPAEDAGNTDSEDDDSTTDGSGKTHITEVTVELELYDAQAAQRLIGQHHKLFTEKVEHDLTDRVLDNAAALIAAMRAGAKEGSDGADG